jgi:hypothetical protein
MSLCSLLTVQQVTAEAAQQGEELAVPAVAVTAVARPQALPDAPAAAQSASSTTATAQPPDLFWHRIQELVHGQEIRVYTNYGPPLLCLFAGATDADLFCDPPGNPAGTGYRLDRASVLNVALTRQAPEMNAGRPKPERDRHPVLLTCMAIGGVLTGVAASKSANFQQSAAIGLLGAGVVGGFGVMISTTPPAGVGIALPLGRRGSGIRRGLPFGPRPGILLPR